MKYVIATAMLFAAAIPASAQAPDPALMAEIHKIKAIDNHSHPPRLVAPGETDNEFDALPCDPLEPTAPNTMTRPENPVYLAAWKSLWGYPYDDRSPAHIQELLAAKQRIRKEQGDHYSAWVLDKLGIETELANRIALGRGLTPPRFRWVAFDDALMLPLNGGALANENPDRKVFYAHEKTLFDRYLKELKVAALPATFSDYLSGVVTAELEQQKQKGAVAIKFEAAYLRSLDFEPESERGPDAIERREAETIYAKYSHGGVPSRGEYLHLQNYLFRYIASEAGRLGLPVHIHTGFGCGGYFQLSGANPLLLESVLNDPRLRKTIFVLLHGGAGPFPRNIAPLLMKPNVYTDLSEHTWMESPRRLSEVLREWLEWYPEKVLFGTDLYPGAAEIDWEEIGWQTTEAGRTALAMALTGMMTDGEINRDRALEIARMVLRGNALKLYGWQDGN
jgi:predicted TIM-barrel fold metal-dependent hydrolase